MMLLAVRCGSRRGCPRKQRVEKAHRGKKRGLGKGRWPWKASGSHGPFWCVPGHCPWGPQSSVVGLSGLPAPKRGSLGQAVSPACGIVMGLDFLLGLPVLLGSSCSRAVGSPRVSCQIPALCHAAPWHTHLLVGPSSPLLSGWRGQRALAAVTISF